MGRKNFEENSPRSLAKSITWRSIVIISDLTIIYLLTHRIDITVGITITTNIAGVVLYYFHERVWNVIRWGKVVK